MRLGTYVGVMLMYSAVMTSKAKAINEIGQYHCDSGSNRTYSWEIMGNITMTMNMKLLLTQRRKKIPGIEDIMLAQKA